MPAKKTRKSASAKKSAAKTAKKSTASEQTVMTENGREKMLFTRDEEHQILVRVVDKFLLFGFTMVGVGWFWITTKVLDLNALQESVLIAGFGIIVMLLIFSLISRDYEFRRHHAQKQ